MDVQPIINLEELSQRPAMYLPARTIYCLKSFVDGVNCEDQTDVWDYLDGFYDWLLDTFNHQDDLGLHCEIKLILHYISQDPYDAFDRFFELLEEFQAGDELMPLFKKIRTNPYQYLSQRSIYALYAYFWGKDMVAQGMAEPIDVTDFEVFVQQKYQMEDAWYKVILFFSQDEFGALNQFQELYGEFIAQPNHASDSSAQNHLPS